MEIKVETTFFHGFRVKWVDIGDNWGYYMA